MGKNALVKSIGRPTSWSESQEKLLVNTVLTQTKAGKQMNEALQIAAEALNIPYTRVRGVWYLRFYQTYKSEIESHVGSRKSNNFSPEEELILAKFITSVQKEGRLIKDGLQGAADALKREYRECHTQWYTYTRKKLDKGILRLDQAIPNNNEEPKNTESKQPEFKFKPQNEDVVDSFVEGLNNIKGFVKGIETVYSRNQQLMQENAELMAEIQELKANNDNNSQLKADLESAKAELQKMKKEYDEIMEAINGARKFFIEAEI